MPSKLVRLQLEEDTELCINLEAISNCHKTKGSVAIFFMGDPDPMTLRGEAAESFWRCLRGSVLTIHHATPGANHQTKIAEVPTYKDFSELSNDD